MTHPGEQFYPQGVHWDDPIARGTVPDLLSTAAAEYGARPAIEYRDRVISYAELADMVEVAAASFLRAGYGANHSVALFLGNAVSFSLLGASSVVGRLGLGALGARLGATRLMHMDQLSYVVRSLRR